MLLLPGSRSPGTHLSLSPLGSKYYEKEALLADPVFGPVLACLLGELEDLEACVGQWGEEWVMKEPQLINHRCLHSGTMCLGIHKAQDS